MEIVKHKNKIKDKEWLRKKSMIMRYNLNDYTTIGTYFGIHPDMIRNLVVTGVRKYSKDNYYNNSLHRLATLLFPKIGDPVSIDKLRKFEKEIL